MIRTTLALAATLALAILQSHSQAAQSAVLRTSDLSLRLQAGPAQPRLLAFAGADRAQWKNAGSEELPAAVEIDGRSVPLRWRHQPSRDINSQGRVSFVYESTQPHLRIEWRWQARAPFGALEHTITVQNLSAHEVWLPMIDSLALEIAQHSATPLTNFYVEKGADTPSAQGTHFETINDGYSWSGHSTTYAFPRKGESREVIPAEIVFDPGQAQSGWFAGIEFSGRTRIALARSGLTLELTPWARSRAWTFSHPSRTRRILLDSYCLVRRISRGSRWSRESASPMDSLGSRQSHHLARFSLSSCCE